MGPVLPKPGAIPPPKGFFLRTGRTEWPVNTSPGDQEISFSQGLFEGALSIDMQNAGAGQCRPGHIADLLAYHDPAPIQNLGDGGEAGFMKGMIRVAGTVFFHRNHTFAADFLFIDIIDGERIGLAEMDIDLLP